MVIGLTGIVSADPGDPAVPETQVISTVTSGDVIGLVMETDAATWTISNGTQIYKNWAEMVDTDNAQYTTAYDASIVAQGGHTAFTKTTTVDTRNKVTSQSNIKTQTGLTFAATENGGNVVGSENLMLDGAGDSTPAADKVLCPFAAHNSYIPHFCNIVQAGSKYDLTIGSVTTSADDAFVHNDATVPVVLNYAINVKPYGTSQGQIPASGSTMGYLKAHVQEGRNWGSDLVTRIPMKAEDLTYSETASALGTITAFNKQFGYASQIAGPLPTWVD
ncbi:MAG: hypothetical protein MUF37_07105 [Methanoregulaceae archaeon]|nr:hypothetical protein [Methanoregulaceae archaeon]